MGNQGQLSVQECAEEPDRMAQHHGHPLPRQGRRTLPHLWAHTRRKAARGQESLGVNGQVAEHVVQCDPDLVPGEQAGVSTEVQGGRRAAVCRIPTASWVGKEWNRGVDEDFDGLGGCGGRWSEGTRRHES